MCCVASTRASSRCLHLRVNGQRVTAWRPSAAPMTARSYTPLCQRLVALLQIPRQVSQLEFLPQGLDLGLVVGLQVRHVSGMLFSQVLPESEDREEA